MAPFTLSGRPQTQSSISRSIELSRSAQKHWQQTSLAERARICENAVAYFESKQNQIAEEIAWQMGDLSHLPAAGKWPGGTRPSYDCHC